MLHEEIYPTPGSPASDEEVEVANDYKAFGTNNDEKVGTDDYDVFGTDDDEVTTEHNEEAM
jgi:hypothetical protein